MFGYGFSALPARPTTLRDAEDGVRKVLEDADEGMLALMYQALYASGYRIATCPGRVAAFKRRLAAKATP